MKNRKLFLVVKPLVSAICALILVCFMVLPTFAAPVPPQATHHPSATHHVVFIDHLGIHHSINTTSSPVGGTKLSTTHSGPYSVSGLKRCLYPFLTLTPQVTLVDYQVTLALKNGCANTLSYITWSVSATAFCAGLEIPDTLEPNTPTSDMTSGEFKYVYYDTRAASCLLDGIPVSFTMNFVATAYGEVHTSNAYITFIETPPQPVSFVIP